MVMNEKRIVLSVENHPNDSRVKIRQDGTVQTLSGRMGTGGNNVPLVLVLNVDVGNDDDLSDGNA